MFIQHISPALYSILIILSLHINAINSMVSASQECYICHAVTHPLQGCFNLHEVFNCQCHQHIHERCLERYATETLTEQYMNLQIPYQQAYRLPCPRCHHIGLMADISRTTNIRIAGGLFLNRIRTITVNRLLYNAPAIQQQEILDRMLQEGIIGRQHYSMQQWERMGREPRHPERRLLQEPITMIKTLAATYLGLIALTCALYSKKIAQLWNTLPPKTKRFYKSTLIATSTIGTVALISYSYRAHVRRMRELFSIN